MGNFEKLSVLVIGVIIVMILVVALYTWTDDPAEPEGPASGPSPLNTPVSADLGGGGLGSGNLDASGEDGWLTWTGSGNPSDREGPGVVQPVPGTELVAHADAPETGPAADDPAREAATEVAERTYTVKPGQTLSHISLEVYGTTKHWPKIAERNKIDPGRLQVGMELIIPTIAAAAPTSDNKPVAATGTGAGPNPGANYTVRSGDTIQKISQAAFGTIERWSDIWIENFERVEDPRFLRVGMTLQIPN